MGDEKIEKKSWSEFQNTGLLLFVNQFLHIFGWVFAVESDDTGSIIDVYPAKTKYKGFKEIAVENAYKKVDAYLSTYNTEIKRGL